MSDYTINQIHVQDVPGLDRGAPTHSDQARHVYGGQARSVYADVLAKDYSAERVQGDMHKEVEALQAIMGGA